MKILMLIGSRLLSLVRILVATAALAIVPALVIYLNYSIDCSGYFQGDLELREVSNMVLAGEDLVGYELLNEKQRYIMKIIANNMDPLPKTIALGSSRILQLNTDILRLNKGEFFNCAVYFFAIVLARSRYKFTCFSRRPFDTELAIYAHERAFEYFGGKPEKILYDQDRVLISRENLGDLVLTRKFQTFVREQHFQPVFCHKADPESKGKVENVVKYVKENFLVARVFRDIDSLNREALEWLERTGNGKVHGTARLVPREEFAVEKSFLIPYHGTPQPPQEEMREYHVRKDNTVQYRGNHYSLPCGTYRSGQTTVWLQETEGNVELYNKDTGKLICRHVLCTRKGRTVYDDSHRKPRNAGVKIAERILFHVSDNREVAMWMDNLKRRKKRYYRDNPEVILRIIPGYDKNTLIEAIRICLDKGIYNGDSVKSLCEYVCRGKDNGTETYGLEDCLPRQGGLIQSYNEILREYDKT